MAWSARLTLAPLLALAPAIHAQDSTAEDLFRPRVLTRGDLFTLGAFAADAMAATPFDVRWTTGLQAPRYQDTAGLSCAATVIREAGDPGAILIAAPVYAAGRVAGRQGLADAGRHEGEAVAVSGLLSLGIKTIVRRQRPSLVSGSDGDEFLVGRRFRSNYASFPSGHTTVAFAAASAFRAELSRTDPRAGRIVTPLLYNTAAAGVGVSRLYNNRHWASDAIVGAAVGTFVGRKLVSLAHRRRRN